MALYFRHKLDYCLLAVWKLDECVSELLALLPNRDRYQLGLCRFTSEHRQKEWLAARILLLELFGEEKEVAYESDGSPFLTDHSYYISISHTKGYVAVIASKDVAVGIDIEQYSDRVVRVFDRFMCPEEEALAYEGDLIWGYLLHWSAKETLYKCIKGATADLKKLCIKPFEPQKSGHFIAQEFWTEKKRMLTVHYCLHSDFVLTWALDINWSHIDEGSY